LTKLTCNFSLLGSRN